MDIYLEKIKLLKQKRLILQHEESMKKQERKNLVFQMQDNSDKVKDFMDEFNQTWMEQTFYVPRYLLYGLFVVILVFMLQFQSMLLALLAGLSIGIPGYIILRRLGNFIYNQKFENLDLKRERLEEQIESLTSQNTLLERKREDIDKEIMQIKQQISEIEKIIENMQFSRDMMIGQILGEPEKRLLEEEILQDYAKHYESEIKRILKLPNNGNSQLL